MNYEISRSSLSLSDIISKKTSPILVEGDIIVPDTKPDIASVIGIDIIPFLSDYVCSDKTIGVRGSVAVKVLYSRLSQPEDTTPCELYTMSSTLSFDNDIILNNVTKTSSVTLMPIVKRYEYMISNERKINVKVYLAFQVSGQTKKEYNVMSAHDAPSCLQKREKSISSYSPAVCRETTFIIKSDFSLPSSCGSISEILSVPVKISERDFKVLGGKLMISADLDFDVLYKTDTASLATFNANDSFREITDADGIDETMLNRIALNIKDIYYEAIPDHEGQTKNIHTELTLCAYINSGAITDTSVICDCFLPGGKVNVSEETIDVSQVVDTAHSVFTLRHSCDLARTMPDVGEIFHTDALCNINSANVKDGYVNLDATVTATVRYLSDSPSAPVCVFTFDVPVNERIELKNHTGNTSADCFCYTDNINCIATKGNVLEFKCSLVCDTTAISTKQVTLINDIEITETDSANNLSSLIAYYASENETVWDIAKKYNVSVESITKTNSLSGDCVLKSAQQVIIPRTKASQTILN